MKALGVIVVATGALLVSGFWWGDAAVKQPVEFPHKTHVQQLNLQCTNCHQRAERDAVAGRPPTALCLACHAGGETKSEEIKKLRAFGENGQEIPWRRVWRLPPHVFFPHRIHVAVARVRCQTCHGPMETLDRPPAYPLRTLKMADCIGCHEQWGASKTNGTAPVTTVARRLLTDCATCHH